MTLLAKITAGRRKREVRVESRHRLSEAEVRAVGVRAVTEALFPPRRETVGRRAKTRGSGHRAEASAGLLADVRRLIRPAAGTFGRELWGEG